MEFNLEKLLTVSARDYVESRGKELGDYSLKGVSFFRQDFTFHFSDDEKVLNIAEVVTDLRFFGILIPNPQDDRYTHERIHYFGTALIPKEQ